MKHKSNVAVTSWWTNQNALRNVSYNIERKIYVAYYLRDRLSSMNYKSLQNKIKEKFLSGLSDKEKKKTKRCSFELLLVVLLIVLMALSNLIMPFSLWEFISTSFSELTDLSSWFRFFLSKTNCFFFLLKPCLIFGCFLSKQN